jgi:hypothetical protein
LPDVRLDARISQDAEKGIVHHQVTVRRVRDQVEADEVGGAHAGLRCEWVLGRERHYEAHPAQGVDGEGQIGRGRTRQGYADIAAAQRLRLDPD